MVKRLHPPRPRRRKRGEYGVRIVTGGLGVPKRVLSLTAQQSKSWAEAENRRPSKAIWLNREPNQEPVDSYSFNVNLGDDADYTDDPSVPLLLDPAVLNFRRRRQRVRDRQKLAENWREAEKRLADVLDGREIAPCSCTSKEIVVVRHIELGCTYNLKPCNWHEMIKV